MSFNVKTIDQALKVLALSPRTLSHASLKTSYLKLAKKYHPDLIPQSEKETQLSKDKVVCGLNSQQKFIELQNSYEILRSYLNS